MTSLLELLLTTLTFIVVCDGVTVTELAVTLYSRTHQSGKQETIDVNRCTNLNSIKICETGWFVPDCLNAADNVESIDTHDNCVRVYRQYNCLDRVGPRIEPGSDCHSDWGADGCGFKNDIRSISPCDEQCIHPSTRLARRSSDRCEVHRLRDDNQIYVTFIDVNGIKVPEFLETYLYGTFSGRTEFRGSYWAMRFRAMLGRAGIDARGHLLASSLGGRAEDWNFAPQRTEINNGDGTGQGWKSLELKIKSHLNKDRCNYVYWQLVIDYDTPRPETFTVTAHFFENWYSELVDVEMVTLQCHNFLHDPIDSFCDTTSQPYPGGRPW